MASIWKYAASEFCSVVAKPCVEESLIFYETVLGYKGRFRARSAGGGVGQSVLSLVGGPQGLQGARKGPQRGPDADSSRKSSGRAVIADSLETRDSLKRGPRQPFSTPFSEWVFHPKRQLRLFLHMFVLFDIRMGSKVLYNHQTKVVGLRTPSLL